MSSVTASDRLASSPDPVLPERSTDEDERGWGADLEDASHDRDEWLRRQRPPHYQ